MCIPGAWLHTAQRDAAPATRSRTRLAGNGAGLADSDVWQVLGPYAASVVVFASQCRKEVVVSGAGQGHIAGIERGCCTVEQGSQRCHELRVWSQAVLLVTSSQPWLPPLPPFAARLPEQQCPRAVPQVRTLAARPGWFPAISCIVVRNACRAVAGVARAQRSHDGTEFLSGAHR